MSFAAELWKLRTEERSLGCARARELEDDISSRVAEGTISPFCLDLARYGNCAGSTVFLGYLVSRVEGRPITSLRHGSLGPRQAVFATTKAEERREGRL